MHTFDCEDPLFPLTSNRSEPKRETDHKEKCRNTFHAPFLFESKPTFGKTRAGKSMILEISRGLSLCAKQT